MHNGKSQQVYTARTIALWCLALAAIVIGGYSFFALAPSDAPRGGQSSDVCIQVITDARDPETGDVHTFPTPCDVPEGWDTLETDHEQISRDGESWTRYRNDDLGLRFEYRVEPDGFTLVEQDESVTGHAALVEHVTLVRTDEYIELLTSSVPREGPPAITVMVFDNPSALTPREWATENPNVSNSTRTLSAMREVSFSGVPAVRYTSDGLYATDTIIAANNGRIYLIAGSYIDEASTLRADFLAMLEYVSLY